VHQEQKVFAFLLHSEGWSHVLEGWEGSLVGVVVGRGGDGSVIVIVIGSKGYG